MGKSRDRAGQEAGSKGGIVNGRTESELREQLEAEVKAERAEELATQVRALADTRHEESALRMEVGQIKKSLATDKRYKRLGELEDEIRSAKKAAAVIRAQLDDAALALYIADGETKLHEAVSIKLSQGLEYDAAEVLRWALDDCRIAVSLDIKLFEHLARDAKFAAALPVGLIVKWQTPKTSVGRDLGEYRTPICAHCEAVTSAWGVLCETCTSGEGEAQ